VSTTSWISWYAAAELTGLPVPTIEHAVRVNRIRRRPWRGRAPTLDASSVEQWAAWYRNLREQKKLNPRPGGPTPRPARPTPAPLPPGEWLSTAEAAEILAVTAATVRRHAELGELEVHRSSARVWVSEKSVRELADDQVRWISRRFAADILGCTIDVVLRLLEEGHLEQRPAHRTLASVSRASVEAHAPVFAEQRAAAQRHKAELQNARAERSQGPADGDVWLKVETTALLLELSTSRVLQLVHAELLPATQIGRRWWLRRSDVERAAAARVFLGRSTSL
jgi:excisionase family DNA binding protein